MALKKSASRVLMGEPEGERSRGRPKHRWQYNIRMYLTEIEWAGKDWIHLPQDRYQWRAFVNTVMIL
jgi:hypothetical protein